VPILYEDCVPRTLPPVVEPPPLWHEDIDEDETPLPLSAPWGGDRGPTYMRGEL
jgi:hypothetical protein